MMLITGRNAIKSASRDLEDQHAAGIADEAFAGSVHAAGSYGGAILLNVFGVPAVSGGSTPLAFPLGGLAERPASRLGGRDRLDPRRGRRDDAVILDR
jgi:hypothetical protein